MDIKDYLKNNFPSDLKKMNFLRPNSKILANPDEYRIDNNTIFFGGQNWENIDNDIVEIDKKNLENFFLCLFTITVIDMGLFTYYHDSYGTFRNKTMYPKFGWSGFGTHYENPKKILSVPLSYKLVDFKETSEKINDFIDLFITECDMFFETNIKNISTNDFIFELINDIEFQKTPEDEDTILGLIYDKLKDRIKPV